MKILNSFFIRWLRSTADDGQKEISVIDIEHIQSGSSNRVSKIEEAEQWMKDITNQERKDEELIEIE